MYQDSEARGEAAQRKLLQSLGAESCCSTAGISYEVVPRHSVLFVWIFLRSRAKLSPKDKCTLPNILSE